MKNKTKIILLLLSTLLMDYLFWNQQWGLNTIIFQALLNSYLWWTTSDKSIQFKTMVLMTLLSGAQVLLYGSVNSIIIHIIGNCLLLGFSLSDSIKSSILGMLQGAASYFPSWLSLIDSLPNQSTQKGKTPKAYRWIKIAALPILFTLVFLILFLNGNHFLGQAFTDLGNHLSEFFTKFFGSYSPGRFFFDAVLLSIAIWTVYRTKINQLSTFEATQSYQLFRSRNPQATKRPSKIKASMLALKTEALQALVLFILMNLLLLGVNLIDLIKVWFASGVETWSAYELSQFVHEGTSISILCVLLGSTIILFHFRKNLNFYKENKTLRLLANAWTAQNLFLLISVAIRNLYYVDSYDLAHKRVGVFVFLIIVAIGLITLLIKVNLKKTLFWLAGSNTWAIYLVILAIGFVDWDTSIAKFNVSRNSSGSIDTEYLYDFSGRTLAYLDQQGFSDLQAKQNLDNTCKEGNLRLHGFHITVYDFMQEQSTNDWQSFGIMRHHSYQQLLDKYGSHMEYFEKYAIPSYHRYNDTL